MTVNQTRRDLTDLSHVDYYGLHHTAAQLLWSLLGNHLQHSLVWLQFSALAGCIDIEKQVVNCSQILKPLWVYNL